MRRKSIEEHSGTPGGCIKVVKSRAKAIKVANYGVMRVLVCVGHVDQCGVVRRRKQEGRWDFGDYGMQNSRQRQTKDLKARCKCVRVDVNIIYKHMCTRVCVLQRKGTGS